MTQVSIIIPLWNGAAVIGRCLDALYATCSDRLAEVICVDNASADDSAARAAAYPAVRLLRQPVNLGFAGGINAGAAAARGDVFALLNQDCLPQPGWLAALDDALAADPRAGIAGSTIYHAAGALDHAGAMMTRPAAYGVHLTDRGNGAPRPADYVTGAAVAIRRSTWAAIGPLDDGFYPAYYEEADYCYRARRRGIETLYAPAAQVVHLRSSREAERDPLKHWANQHRSRYRFVAKHWTADELTAFFAAETAALAGETAFPQAAGRLLAGRDTLRGLAEILQRRALDLDDDRGPAGHRHLEAGFTAVIRAAFAAAERLCEGNAQAREAYTLTDGRLVSWSTRLRRAWRTFRPSFFGPTLNHLERRLALLEALADYDYR